MKNTKSTLLIILALISIFILNPFSAYSQVDGGVTAIVQPTDSTVYGSQITTKFIFKNFGQDTLYQTPCLLYIDRYCAL